MSAYEGAEARRMILELPDDTLVPVALVRKAFGVSRVEPDDEELMIQHAVGLMLERARCTEKGGRRRGTTGQSRRKK